MSGHARQLTALGLSVQEVGSHIHHWGPGWKQAQGGLCAGHSLGIARPTGSSELSPLAQSGLRSPSWRVLVTVCLGQQCGYGLRSWKVIATLESPSDWPWATLGVSQLKRGLGSGSMADLPTKPVGLFMDQPPAQPELFPRADCASCIPRSRESGDTGRVGSRVSKHCRVPKALGHTGGQVGV